MGAFDVSFLNPKLRKSSGQDYGFLVDQLSIQENALAADGKLSPGDYDVLRESAMKLYAHPGLTPAQRSNVQVKISDYEKAKKVNIQRDNNDIGRLDRELKDDMAKVTMRFGNNPEKFLTAQAAVQKAKIDQLSNSIDQLEVAGDDTTNHYNELNTALQDYNDTLTALNDVKTYDGSGTSKSNYAAYLTTNSDGEIVGMQIKKYGGQSGYMPTNGIYGGLPVYGKVNTSENGLSVFKLGAQQFKESSSLVTGPDGVSQQKVLVAGGGGPGGITVNGKNVDIQPNTVKTQSSIRTGAWVEGSKGFLYQRQSDGSYVKHVGTDKEKLGITDNDVLRIPSSFEQNIQKSVRETVDMMPQVNMPTPTVGTPAPSPAPAQPSQIPPQATGGMEPRGSARTPAPTARAPQSAAGIAGQQTGEAKGFFSRLFGK